MSVVVGGLLFCQPNIRC